MSLVFMTVIAVVAGRGLVEMGRAYVFAKKNALIAQQGQITMTRLKKEISAITSISQSSNSSITFTRLNDPCDQTSGSVTVFISWAGVGNPILILMGNSQPPGDILAGILSSPNQYSIRWFNLNYYDTYNAAPSASASPTTSIIEIGMQLDGAENTTIRITDRVNLSLATGA